MLLDFFERDAFVAMLHDEIHRRWLILSIELILSIDCSLFVLLKTSIFHFLFSTFLFCARLSLSH